MIGISPAMRETFALLEKVAASDLTVLVEGETGTGKELAAEGLHEASRRSGAFVAVSSQGFTLACWPKKWLRSGTRSLMTGMCGSG